MAMQTAPVPLAATSVPGAASADFPLRLRPVKEHTLAIQMTFLDRHYKLNSRIRNTLRSKNEMQF